MLPLNVTLSYYKRKDIQEEMILAAKNKEIAELLESKAVSLLDSILVADYEKTKNMVYSIITLTGLLVDSGTLHPVNREVLIRESERINLAIEALPKMKRETLPDLNLGKIFSKTVKLTKQEIQSEIADKDSADRIADKNFADEIADKSEIRQSAINSKNKSHQPSCRRQSLLDPILRLIYYPKQIAIF